MENVFEETVRSGQLVLVDFYATWCGPCMAMMPLLSQLERELGKQVQFLKIDVDKNTELAVQMKVMGVPTFVLYHDGREQWRHPGTLTKTELLSVLHRHLD